MAFRQTIVHRSALSGSLRYSAPFVTSEPCSAVQIPAWPFATEANGFGFIGMPH